MAASPITIRVDHGAPIVFGALELQLVTQSVQVRSPLGSFIWNRPVSARVRGEDGQESTLAIHDVTGWAVFAALASAALFGLSALVVMRARRHEFRRNL